MEIKLQAESLIRFIVGHYKLHPLDLNQNHIFFSYVEFD
jgi:hypothetical protein